MLPHGVSFYTWTTRKNPPSQIILMGPIMTAISRSLLLFGLFSFSPGTATAEKNILPAPERVSEHVYAWIGPYGGPNKENKGFRMNMAFAVGTKAVAVFETGYTPAMAREMIAHIRAITKAPIRYAVNTNSQPDRFFGNDVFAGIGAEIITTPQEAARMAERGGDFAFAIERSLGLAAGSIDAPAKPTRLVEKTTTLDLGGGVTVRLQAVGGTHTPNSLIAVIDGDKTVYTGDALYGGRLLAVLPGSTLKTWIAAFDGLRQYKGYTFIPGHGRPGPLSDFEFPTYQYLSTLEQYMAKAVEEGVSLNDATVKFDQSKYSKLVNFKDLAGKNASWAYQAAEWASFE